MQQESMSLVEFQKRFVNDEACMAHLFRLRWPDGYTCPRCGHRRCCFHKTLTPLVKWFWMIFMMARQKSGVSMLSLQRMLGIRSYKNVWTMGRKIRKAMEDRDSQYQLAGLVEMDDAFIGPRKPGPPGRGAIGKSKVVIAVESRDKHAGFAVTQHVQPLTVTRSFQSLRTKSNRPAMCGLMGG
ncbi:MAG: IS1595 family transposase [Desulfomonilaceae bacterium]